MRQPKKFKDLKEWQRKKTDHSVNQFQDIKYLRNEALKGIKAIREYKRVKKEVIKDEKLHEEMLKYFDYLDKLEKQS